MLHVFLNPKRNINKIIKNILDNGDIEYKSYFPNESFLNKSDHTSLRTKEGMPDGEISL